MEKHEAASHGEFILSLSPVVPLQLVVHLTALKKKDNILLFSPPNREEAAAEGDAGR